MSDQRRREEMSGFCKAIASKAAAFQALDTTLDAFSAEEGMNEWTTLVSDQTIAFCVFPMIQRPLTTEYLRYVVRRKLLPLRIIQVGYTVSAK